MGIGGVTIDHTDDPVLNTHGHTEHGDQSLVFRQFFLLIEGIAENVENGHGLVLKGHCAHDAFPHGKASLLQIFVTDALSGLQF